MPRQLCWLSKSGTDGEKVLYLRTAPNEPWKPYTHFPQYAIPDYQIPGGSKGWATYQKLIKQGWILVPSARATEFGKVATEAEILY
ncbi:hypothetical protein IQ230_18140 [Gloeocapsopsis crepidinum LEGE 06123]|uniref:Uncharacterized protein n=1 Tax=Gloeocapsopsis crepidinum LEGE 06123 TaxID=588587 RepID=A0ABR9UVB0_9CHRO|nr:hypothetical protein [Gloeocapsopsis crepidinum]MBE9192240.1 hypothetical protein [Gloeocapsopsis crepidinum LEGE 06123]